MKILIAVPTFENITPDTFKSIYGLDPCGNWLVFDFLRGYDCAQARNRIAQEAIDEGCDYVLMVDNDIVLPSDALKNMLEEPVDVLLGAYANRNGNNVYTGATCLCRLDAPDGSDYYHYPTESEYSAQEVIAFADAGIKRLRIHGGGFGCALVRTEVLHKLEWPWFKWVDYEDGHGTLSEDLFFCERCKAAGVPIYADPRVRCGHVFRFVQEVV